MQERLEKKANGKLGNGLYCGRIEDFRGGMSLRHAGHDTFMLLDS